MDLSTARYIMDYLYFNRANETIFHYYKKVSLPSIDRIGILLQSIHKYCSPICMQTSIHLIFFLQCGDDNNTIFLTFPFSSNARALLNNAISYQIVHTHTCQTTRASNSNYISILMYYYVFRCSTFQFAQ